MWFEPQKSIFYFIFFGKMKETAGTMNNPNNLRDNLLFREMTDEELSECLAALNAKKKDYEKGEYILHAGDFTDRMGIVLGGSVTIESNDIWGNCTVLSNVGKNGFFAETYALLKNSVLLVDVKANTDTEVLFLNIGNLQKRAFSETAWGRKLLASLLAVSLRKNLTLSERNFHTAPKTIRGKLLSYLSTVSLQKRKNEFDIPFDRQQLADYLGVDRTALSKELGRMRSEGMIECSRNHFVILSLPAYVSGHNQ